MTSCTRDQVSQAIESRLSSCSLEKQLEKIDEFNIPASGWLPCPAPETPTESMEFLARSWSLSAMELSKALSFNTHANLDKLSFSSSQPDLHDTASLPICPRDSEEIKELFILHQALNPEFLSSQQLLKTGVYKSIMRGRTMGRWLKDQKERKKHEMRTHNAQLHAAVSVAGVAAAVASNAMSAAELAASKTSTAMASAAALVASHCIEIAEDIGAEHEQILTLVCSAVNAKTSGDIMTLTAGAATALRGAATLRARLEKGCGFMLREEKGEQDNDSNMAEALNLVARGGQLLKRTRKGDLHWKQVSFNINTNWQVVAKLKSKHMGGTFTKKNKFVVSAVYDDIPKWPRRDREDRDYFAIQTSERTIEFECRNQFDKKMWTEGIHHMLNLGANTPSISNLPLPDTKE